MSFTLLIINSIFSQTWNYVGSGGISSGQAISTSLALDPTGTPYVAYVDAANGFIPAVVKWNGISWSAVGNAAFEGGTTSNLCLTIDKNGTPYVAYEDGLPAIANSLHGKLTVIKWNGSNWVYVGSPGISDTEAVYFSLACDPNGVPYVAYTDGVDGNSGIPGPGIVKKWNGNSWVTVGSADVTTDLQNVEYPAVGFDASGNAFLAYYNEYNNAGWMSQLQGGYWMPQGAPTPSFSPSVVQYVSLAFDTGGTPYVAYQDQFNGATVMKLVGQTWTAVGNPSFTSTVANYTSLAIDPSGVPYVAYQAGGGGKAEVEKFNGSSWVSVGMGYITTAEADYTSLAIDASGTPYIAFEDYFNNQKLTVMRYGTGTTGITEPSSFQLSIYPNPAKGNIQVKYKAQGNPENQIALIDVTGKVVYHGTAEETGVVIKTINTSNFAPGIYVIQLKIDGEIRSERVVVE